MAEPQRRYWDSSAFLALIKNEPGRAEICENIVNDARGGLCEIYTSTITLTEVVKRRPKENPIDPKTEAVLTAFFRNTFIRLVPVDVNIAIRARRLIWDFPWLGARDAIHIATALELKLPTIEHYDDDDIGKVAERIKREKLVGFPEIRHPRWVGQLPLQAPAEQAQTPPQEPESPASSAPKAPPATTGSVVSEKPSDETPSAAKETETQPATKAEPTVRHEER